MGKQSWKCATCGEILHSWAASERHADALGHRRIELVIDDEAGLR